MQYLDQKLQAYQKSDFYPFHMPGHKRRTMEITDPYQIDITEIDGFDNLHHADGILKEAQQRAAQLYQAQKSYYLINGSTCGILAAICAATSKRDKILLARNSHKAVYHGAFLNELQTVYLYPQMIKDGIQGVITPEQVEEAFVKNPDISAVVVTSPTYEGIVSNIREIAAIAHAHEVPLIVDEAHGAHFGFSNEFPKEAGKEGADAVIMSLHKTLPSLTQTALLHLFSNRIDAQKVEKYLGIYQTSSPSYVLMAGMERCIRLLCEEKTQIFINYEQLLKDFYQQVKGLLNLHVLCREDLGGEEAYDWDCSKLVIFSKRKECSGQQLHTILREEFHLQMEMVSAEYVLGMTSIMDTKEGLDRLASALRQIDQMLETGERFAANVQHTENKQEENLLQKIYQPKKAGMQIYQAEGFGSKEIELSAAAGKLSAEYIYLYPPGIPMIVPGEMIEQDLIDQMMVCRKVGLSIEGAKKIGQNRINIVYF